jgi:hypothetical protein
MKPRVIVLVSGGVVQGAYASSKDIRVDVLDYDNFNDVDESPQMKRRYKKLEDDIDLLVEVY